MDWKLEYDRWMANPTLDQELKQQLLDLKEDEKALEDCFYQQLTFGTGGIRGVIGPGTNRMNIYTIRKASEGLARYIAEQGEEAKSRGVVIAYDSRHKSPEFAMEAALTLGNQGIKTYVFDELRPTPELSFAVRYLHAFAGIVITASHNPPEYNGFKVYGPDGGQIPPEAANKIINKVNEVKNELAVEIADKNTLIEKELLTIIGEHIDAAYNEQLKGIVLNAEIIKEMADDVNIVFTPLHGTANKPVRRVLEDVGFKNVTIVTEQELPDANFSTVDAPNPEEHAAFEYAIRYGEKVNADILIGTDPDADRLGIAVKNRDNEYVVLTGNQTGALMLNYLLSQKKEKGTLPENGIVLKTIVTSEIGRAIAADFGLHTEDTLTGFKFIGEKIKEYEQTKEYTFQFGYEESYGYLIGDFARDKDAVQAALLAAEMCAYYKANGRSLYEQLQEIFKKYGAYIEGLRSLTLKGKEGAEKIAALLTHFRENPPSKISGSAVDIIEDYEAQKRILVGEQKEEVIDLPTSNVLKYFLEDGSWVCLRPSGTEPKVKFYFGIVSNDLQSSECQLEKISEDLMNKVNEFLQK